MFYRLFIIVAFFLADCLCVHTALADTYTVTTTSDSGTGSLRSAISLANNNPGRDIIYFDASIFGQSITLQSLLPIITDNVLIDGQGHQIKLIGLGVNVSGTYGFRIEDTASGSGIYNLSITGMGAVGIEGFADNITIKKCIFSGNRANIVLFNSDGSTITGNHILDGADGIKLNFCIGGIIGGQTVNEINHIRLGGITSRNSNGIYLAGSDNVTVQKNYIEYDGTTASNFLPIRLEQANHNLIGGGSSLGNTIPFNTSGQYNVGIYISASDSNSVFGNKIGEPFSSTTIFYPPAIYLTSSSSNWIGNVGDKANIIGYCSLEDAEAIWLDADSHYNRISGNRLHYNVDSPFNNGSFFPIATKGIDINLTGNKAKRKPTIQAFTVINGSLGLIGTSEPLDTVEVFLTDNIVNRQAVYSTTVLADTEGNWFTTDISQSFSAAFMATARDSLMNTSEFSNVGELQLLLNDSLNTCDDNTILSVADIFTSYSWTLHDTSNNVVALDTTYSVTASKPGVYILEVLTADSLTFYDSIIVTKEDCITPIDSLICTKIDTTTLTFPTYQLKEVINTSAQTLSDNWLLSKYTPFNVYGALGYDLAEAPPYAVGKQGIWRGESSFAYVTDRKQTAPKVNLAKDGTYTLNMFNWKYLGELDCPEWRKVETVSEYHPQSSDVERYNILKLYSSFHIGYSDQLVSAAATNSKQYEFGFEGFEEYTSQIDKANANLLFSTQATVNDLKIPYWFTLETGRNRRIWSSLELQTLQNQYAFVKLHILGKQIDVNYPGEFRSHTAFEEITIEDDKSLIKFDQNEDAPFEGFWTGKVGVTINKIATQTFSGTAPQLVDGIAHTGTKSLKINASASFEQPYLLLIPNKKYVVSAWVRVDQADKPLRSASYQDYANLKVQLGNGTNLEFKPEGQIIEGWQRIEGSFTVPSEGMGEWSIELVNNQGVITYFDDIRLFPSLGNMESFVYDTETFRLEAKLDANNYATFYYYDAEGRLYLVKQETAKGVQTLQTVTTHTKRD